MAGNAQKNPRKTSYRNDRDVYVYGSAAAQREYEREAEKQRRRERADKRQINRIRRDEDRMRRIFSAYIISLVLILMSVGIVDLQIRSRVKEKTDHIDVMRQELSEKIEENTTKYNVIIDSVNLDEVREKAINDLGMTSAGKDQIMEYNETDGGYIKQYEEIPEEGVLTESEKSKR